MLGPTGSGKTSLVNLVPRFYDTTDGEVLIDGRKVSFFEITHSNPFTFGVAIDTTEGNIIFNRTVELNSSWNNKK